MSNYNRGNNSRDLTPWIVVGIVVILILLFVVFFAYTIKSGRGSKTDNDSTTYTSDEALAPRAVLSKKYFNAGQLKNKTDLVTHSFNLSNQGQSNLVISKLTTSCHCTTAQLIYDGRSSQKWGMASGSDWQVSIKPGDTAVINIEYDPKKMISDGLIQRAIYIITNDPKQPELTYQMDVENNL